MKRAKGTPRTEPFKGEVKLSVWSRLKKLSRAIRRDKVEPEHSAYKWKDKP